MSDASDRRSAASLARGAVGMALGREGRIGSTVYGTVLVLAALAAAYAAERHEPLKLVELVVTAVLVFWLAYVYAQALSESIQRRSRLDRPLLSSIADRELGIILAAVLPIGALCLGALGIVTEHTSLWLAILVGVAMLSVQGYRYSRAAALGGLATAGILVVNLLLGLSIVILKVTIVH
jgi:hypothetical protein